MSGTGLQLSGVPSTNVPQPTFSALGFSVPTDSQILNGVMADLNQAFGGNLNITNLATPQGQLASSMAALISYADQLFLYYTTQTDPAFAKGRMQDAIGRIYFIERLPASQTVVACTCTGAQGTVIPTGAFAQDTSGNTYLCTGGGTIPAGGSISLEFANVVTGPIPCPQGTLTTIYKAIPGWDSITNPNEGVLGSDVESQSAFETRRQASVAQNSNSSLQSIIGAVLNVPGVIDAYATENATASSVTVGGQILPANSLYIAVVGGAAADVAQAIWSRKAPGCAYVGNTTQTVTDTSNGYNPPYPTYNVTWEVPPSLPIYFSVTLYNNSGIPNNAATLIQNALVNAFAGGDGGPRARIGNNLLASRYIAPIAALGSWALIQSLYLGSANVPTVTIAGTISGTTLTVSSTEPNAQFTGSISGTTLTVSSAVAGAIVAGNTLNGTGVTGGTTIVQQLTTNTWQVSASQTVASTAMNTTGGALAVGLMLQDQAGRIAAGTKIVSGSGPYTLSTTQTVSGASGTGSTSGASTTLTLASVTGTVVVGDYVSGTNIASGTYIAGFGTGTGGAGTYTLSQASTGTVSGTVTTTPAIVAVNPNQNNVQVNINQVPTIAAANVLVGTSSV